MKNEKVVLMLVLGLFLNGCASTQMVSNNNREPSLAEYEQQLPAFRNMQGSSVEANGQINYTDGLQHVCTSAKVMNEGNIFQYHWETICD